MKTPDNIRYLINWNEVSRILTGRKENIAPKRIPKKYEKRIKSLFDKLKDWEDEGIK